MARSSAWLSVVLALFASVFLVSVPVHSFAQYPVIYTVRGCAMDMGNGTAGCNFNDTIWVRGSNLPTSDISTLVSTGWPLLGVVSYNSSLLSGRLDYMGNANPTTYSLRVYGKNVVSNVVNYITFGGQTPFVYSVTGCAINNRTANSTSGCQAGNIITITGSKFLPTTPYHHYVWIGGIRAMNCTYVNTSVLLCVLPSVPSGYLYRWLDVDLYMGSLSSANRPSLVMYSGSPSLPSSTGRFVNTTSSSSSSSTGGSSSGNSSATCPVSRLLPGYDLPGYDLYHVSQPSVNFVACQTLCCNNLQCVAFSVCQSNFNDSACALNQPCCFLKSGVAVPVMRNNTIAQLSSAVISRSASFSSSSSTGSAMAVTISSMGGCALDQCKAGDSLVITGTGITSKMTIYLNDNGVRYMCGFMIFSNSSRIVCNSLPKIPNVSRPFYVLVQLWNNVELAASVGLIYYPTLTSSSSSSSTGRFIAPTSSRASSSPYVSGIGGCQNNRCTASQQVSVYGSGFDSSSQVRLYYGSTYYICMVSYRDQNQLQCTLPSILVPSAGAPVQLQVWNGVFASTTWSFMYYPLLYSSSSSSTGVAGGVTITTLSGCAIPNQCQAGDNMVLSGFGFASTMDVYLFASGSYYTCVPKTFINASRIICRLSSIQLQNNQPLYVQVQLWNNGISAIASYGMYYYPTRSFSSSSTGRFVNASSSSSTGGSSGMATITSIWGCLIPAGSGTSGCNYNDTIYVNGNNMPVMASGVTLVLTMNNQYQYFATIVTSSSTYITARLPYLPVTVPTTVSVQLRVNNVPASNAVSYVTFVDQSPVVYRVSGCALDDIFNRTSGCQAGMTVTVVGERFVPTYSITALIQSNYRTTTTCTYISRLMITCVMPTVPTTLWNQYLNIQVQVGSLYSNAPYLVLYSPPRSYSSSSSTGGAVAVSITGLSGCQIPNQCVAGDRLVLTGNGYVIGMEVALQVSGVNYFCASTWYYTSTTLVCNNLPDIPMPNNQQQRSIYVQVQVYNNGYLQASTPMYYYPTPSASSSSTGTFTGGSGGGSSSGLTLDDLIVIVLVVVIVVGLLLVCQVVYCLHHFAGVKFPRLARLTGGRLFKVEVEAAEGAEIDLSLLAHDQQHQQPMLEAAHAQPQPQSPQLPPNAAAVYQSPVYYQPPTQQYAPAAHYPASHPPPPAAAPYMYPRSFVPSPQYYQSS